MPNPAPVSTPGQTAGQDRSFDCTSTPSDQAPMQQAACEAYKPGSQAAFRNNTAPDCNERMGDERMQQFLDTNLSTEDLYASCSRNTSDRSNGQNNRPSNDCDSDNRGGSDRGSDNHNRHGRGDRDDDCGNDNSDRRGSDNDRRGDRYDRDECHMPRDTHSPCDTTDLPNTRTERCPSDRVIIEPCGDRPRPPLNAGEFVVVVINVSAAQMDRAGDFIGRLLGNVFDRDSDNGSTRGGRTGFHLDGIPTPNDILNGLFGGRDGGRDGGGIPNPGDILGGLPGIGELFGGGDDSQSGSSNGLPSPGEVLGSLPGLGNFFGGGGSGRDGIRIPTPGNLLGSLPGPGDLLGNLPGMGGGIPSPGDILGELPLPGLGGDGKIPMPHEIIEDAAKKPLKSIKNLFKKIF